MKVPRTRAITPYIPTASMADIAFLLIIFFMVTTVFDVDRSSVEPPESMTQEEFERGAAVVVVSTREGSESAPVYRFSAGEDMSVVIQLDELPALIDDAELWLQDNIDEDIDLTELRDEFVADGRAADLAGQFADDVVNLGTALINIIFQAFTVALFTFYLVAEGPKLRRTICSFLKPQRQAMVLEVWDLAIQKTGGYIYSRGILAVFSAAVLGSALAFLWWNAAPAKIIMGDTGSHAIGGAMAALAILTNTQLLLIILGKSSLAGGMLELGEPATRSIP